MYSFFKEFYEWRELFFLFVKIIYNFSSPPSWTKQTFNKCCQKSRLKKERNGRNGFDAPKNAFLHFAVPKRSLRID